MTWVKVDDKAPSNPKLLAVGHEAGWLWLCGLCYCNAHATDGRIPFNALHALYPHPKWTARALKSLARALVAVGLWDLNEDHYTVHDYAEYQEEALKTSVEERREASKLRKRQQRERERLRIKPPNVTRDMGVTVTRDSDGTPACDTRGTPAWDEPPFYSGVSQAPGPARPDPAELRTNNISTFGTGTADEVLQLLKTGYKQRYEKHSGDVWMAHAANDKKMREVATYVRNAPGEPAEIVNEILDGLFANPKATAERWPWGWLAMDPGKYRPDRTAEREAAARARRWDEIAEANKRAEALQAQEPQPESKAMTPEELERMANEITARLASTFSSPKTKPKSSEAAE